MADTLSERLTGPSATAPVSVALNLVMADTSLFGDDDCPRWCQDYGPISATALRLLVRQATAAHTDKATAHRDGGPTTTTNGLGSCAACNYTKDQPGWTMRTTEQDGVHTATWTTPTAATYRSTAPPPPGPPVTPISPLEHRLGINIVDLTTWRLKHTTTHRPPVQPDAGDDDGPEPGTPEHNGPGSGAA
ncbi:hypothetical protein [Mycolicibacterium sp.]|uniref:hypothetical protein n=1 Tax=Mycolicibacterium sp. TaxID=2320850 RepID=UPI003D0E9AC2